MTRPDHNLAGEDSGYGLAGDSLPPMSEPHKRNLPRIIWRNRLIVLLTLLAGAGAGFAYVHLATPIYSGVSRLYIQQAGPKIMATEDANALRSTNFLATECQVFCSGPILAATMVSPGIKELKTFQDSSAATSILAKNLKATVGKNDELITVAFESPYAEDAARVTNAAVDAYIAYQSSRKRSTASEVLKILQKEKNRRDTDMAESLKAMLDFQQSHPELGFQGEKGNIIIQRLDRLSAALTEAELAAVDAKATFDAVNLMKDDPAQLRQFLEARRATDSAISVGDEDSRLQNELTSLKMQMESMKDKYAASQPALMALEKNIAMVRQQIADRDVERAKQLVAVVGQHYEMANQKLQRVQAAYEEQMNKSTGLNKVMAEYARLQNEWEQSKKIVEVLDARIKELNVTQDVGALNITVLETAGPPGKPIKPDRPKAMGISLAVGLMLGIGLALLRDWADPRLTSSQEVSSALGAPVLGSVPVMEGKKKDVAERGRVVLQIPRSLVAEAYRGVRTALSFGLPAIGERTILVTSPGAGDGKSTLVSNLGISMMQAGQRVLIIDADFHHPRQHVIFQTPNMPGLADVLSGLSTLEQAISVNEGRPDVLVSGSNSSHSSELLHGRPFVELLKELAGRYDRLIIDSPPVMAITDSLVLAALSDVTLLVVRAEQSHLRLAEQTRESLQGVGARVFGVVVNAVPGKTHRYGGYHGGYYTNGRSNGRNAGTEIVRNSEAASL